MSNKGKVLQVKEKEFKGKTYYNAKLDDNVWYGCGPKALKVGDYIEFDVESNGDFKNAKNIKVVEAPVANVKSAPASGATDWAAKDRSISWQAARNSANALLAVGAQAGYQDFPASFSELVKRSDELTLKFFQSSQNPGGTSAAVAGSKPPAPKKRPQVEADEGYDESPFDDPLP